MHGSAKKSQGGERPASGREKSTMSRVREDFQKTFADWLGVPYAFAFWRGRVAIYAILRALGIQEGDEVILPGYTCVVAVNPIKYLGAKPVYVDIEPHTYNIDVDQIERRITPRTKLLVAQHTYGYPAEMEAILDIARRHGLPVMEDSCLAVGSTYKGRKTGTFGLASCFSGQWNKPFTTGIGGIAVTADRELAEKIRRRCEQEAFQPGRGECALLAAQRLAYKAVVFPQTTAAVQWLFRWLVRKKVLVGSATPSECRLEPQREFFKLMGNGQARCGRREVARLETNLQHRRRMTALYDRLLTERGWPRRVTPDYIDPVLVRYPIRVADKARAVALAARKGIELGTWFESPLHQALVSLDHYDYAFGSCPVAERATREVVNLPTHRRVSPRVARKTVNFICRIGPSQL